MSADEIIKYIPEIASATKVVVAAVPFTAIVKRMLGPAADEVAQMWADNVKMWRFERQASCVRKAEAILRDAGITPHTVPPKILFPLLEGASFEEDENLHDMWAALLANAASLDNSTKVEASFIAILKQISPDEAKLLQWFMEFKRTEFSIVQSVVNEYMKTAGISNAISVQRCFDALESYQLIRRAYFNIDSEGLIAPSFSEPLPSLPTMTDRGRAFLEACTPPKPKP